MKNNEQYIRVTDIKKAFKGNDEALAVIDSVKAFDLHEILQKEESAEFCANVKEIVEYLNSAIGSHYKTNVDKTRSFIRARLREGFTVDDFKTVIDKKARAWLGNKDMQKYLRPETLFGTKFESYLNEQETYKFTGNKQESSFERIQRLAREGAFNRD
jgi:uncharacterized phage protein (TIGR02220 family)